MDLTKVEQVNVLLTHSMGVCDCMDLSLIPSSNFATLKRYFVYDKSKFAFNDKKRVSKV